MRTWLKMSGVITGAVLAFGATEVQAQGVAGTWTWEVQTRIRRDASGTTPTGDKSQAQLVLDVRGDSVFGTYTVSRPGATETAPVPREVRGTVNGNKVVFSLTQQGRVNINGEERESQMTATYTLTINGDEITGVIETTSPDLPVSIPPRTFSGRRAS